MNEANLRQHVISQLTPIGGIVKGEEIQILCPFHSDHTPSLNVHIGHKITPGSYHCFACQAKGGWNRLAAALRLVKIDNNTTTTSLSGDSEDPFRLLAEKLKQNPILKKETYRTLMGTEPLPDSFNWRGYDQDFYTNLGGSYFWTPETEYLYFPLTVYGEYKGYTLIATQTTSTNFNKYQIFAEAKKVFFLFDQLPENETIILTEGHFDAMRLIAEGFNATAILGVNNWSEHKRELLVSKRPRKILIALDGDEAGYAASVKIFEDLCGGMEVDIFYLPPQNPSLDPGNMPPEQIKLLRERIIDDRIQVS